MWAHFIIYPSVVPCSKSWEWGEGRRGGASACMRRDAAISQRRESKPNDRTISPFERGEPGREGKGRRVKMMVQGMAPVEQACCRRAHQSFLACARLKERNRYHFPCSLLVHAHVDIRYFLVSAFGRKKYIFFKKIYNISVHNNIFWVTE